MRLIRLYQKSGVYRNEIFRALWLSDSVCRFTPTCAEYTYLAVEKYGAGKGLVLGLKRIVRCHPWSAGGYDPVK